MIPYGDYPDLAGVRRILVVKLRHHGDVLLTSPLFAALKREVPAAEVDALIYAETEPMLAGHPAIGHIHLYDRKWKSASPPARARAELRLLREIRESRYDMAINLTEGDRGALTAWFSGARFRVGWDPQGQGLSFKKYLYTHIVRRAPTPRHMVEQNLDAIRRIGVFPAPEQRDLIFTVPESARAAVRERLAAGGVPSGEFVLLHMTSRWLFKCWPLRNVVALVDALARRGRRIVLSGAPDARELDAVAQVRAACRDVPLTDFAGQLTLKELGALIESARCLVCVDSVPAHIASALKTPCAVLFGPSCEKTWGPWRNPRARVVAQDLSCRPCNLDGCGGSKVSDCLETLALERVLDAVDAAWGG